jgi:NitT/TauT family transport system substrate-binding protein
MPIVTGLETRNLTVFDFPGIDSAGLYIARNEGLFRKEGLNVSVLSDDVSSQDTVAKIESGKGQISSGDYVTYMSDFAGQDPNLEIIGEGSVLEPNVLTLMTGPGSKITSLKQLAGKTLPVSGKNDIANLLIDSVLADNNVPVNSVKYKPDIKLGNVPSDIASGMFATGPVPQPFVTIGEQQLGEAVLADLNQGSTTNFPLHGYAVTRQWAQQNPNTLKAFVTALDEGQELADTERGTLEKTLEGAPLKIAVGVAAVINTPQFPTDVEPARIQRVMDEMIQFNFFTSKKTLAAAKAFDARKVVYSANLATASGQSSLLGG